MKKILLALAAILGVSAAMPSVAHAVPTCGFAWTQISQSAFDFQNNEVLSSVTATQGACEDVLTIQFASPSSGYTVQYVTEVTEEGTGVPVPLDGDAQLQIVLRAPGFDGMGNQIYPGNTGDPLPGIDLTGYEAFRDVKFAGRSASVIRLGLGVRAKTDFKVTKSPTHVTIRVSHL